MDINIQNKEIDSVKDLLDILELITSRPYGSRTVSSASFYRGQGNYKWILTPSLFRSEIFNKETYMIKKIKHLSENELNNLDRFSQLVKLQHYGLPTRLLDLTENPLVALYFACESCSNSDGSFYIFNNCPTHWSDDALVETYMDFVHEIGFNNIDVEEYLKYYKNKYSGQYSSRRKIKSEKDLIYDLSLDMFAVYPRQNNHRILAQQGAFFVFGSKFQKVKVSTNPGNVGKRYLMFEPGTSKEISDRIIKIKINKHSKRRILRELDSIGINRMKLFPEFNTLVSNVVENTVNELK